MNQPPNNGNGYGDGHDGYDGYGSGAPYGSGPYGDSRQHDGGYGTGQDPYASPGGQQDPYGAPGQQSPYGQPGSGNTGFPSQHQGQGYGPGQPQGNQYPGHGGVYGAAAAGQAGQSAGSGGGIGGLSPKMLGIIGGGVALVLVILLILVFVVFGDSEEKDRRNAIKAAEKFVDTLAEGERFSELNSQLCSRHQADERDVEEIDDEMAAMAYDLPELFYLDQDDIDDLREMSFTERDVEFTSDARREAIIYFDVVDDELTFRNVDGDWMVCDSAFDMSDTDVDYFYWN